MDDQMRRIMRRYDKNELIDMVERGLEVQRERDALREQVAGMRTIKVKLIESEIRWIERVYMRRIKTADRSQAIRSLLSTAIADEMEQIAEEAEDENGGDAPNE